MATATRHLSSSTEGKTPKAKINKENLRQALALFKYLKPYRGKFILGLVFIALSAFTTSLVSFIPWKNDRCRCTRCNVTRYGWRKFTIWFRVKRHSLELKYNVAAHLRSIDSANFLFIYESLFANSSRGREV
jgi:hypothetical protein